MTANINILSAGAAKALVQQLQAEWETTQGVKSSAKFGAVGAMKEALLSGEPCDVFIVTQSMLQDLIASGKLEGSAQASLGKVLTGLAVPAAQAQVPIETAAQLADFLRKASGIYFPDPERATAGIHFAKVMQELGLKESLSPRFKTFPNGALCMAAMAQDASGNAAGCTQVSEIMYTPGVRLVGALPKEFELATLYAGTSSASAHGDPSKRALAARFVAELCSTERLGKRQAAGFVE